MILIFQLDLDLISTRFWGEIKFGFKKYTILILVSQLDSGEIKFEFEHFLKVLISNFFTQSKKKNLANFQI